MRLFVVPLPDGPQPDAPAEVPDDESASARRVEPGDVEADGGNDLVVGKAGRLRVRRLELLERGRLAARLGADEEDLVFGLCGVGEAGVSADRAREERRAGVLTLRRLGDEPVEEVEHVESLGTPRRGGPRGGRERRRRVAARVASRAPMSRGPRGGRRRLPANDASGESCRVMISSASESSPAARVS